MDNVVDRYALWMRTNGATSFFPSDGTFWPFKDRRGGDFQIELLQDYLELNDLQRKLLDWTLKDLELRIWFSESGEDEDRCQYLELAVYWDCFDVAVAQVNLTSWLEKALKGRNDIGDDAEIKVLENLKQVIDAAITERKENPWTRTPNL